MIVVRPPAKGRHGGGLEALLWLEPSASTARVAVTVGSSGKKRHAFATSTRRPSRCSASAVIALSVDAQIAVEHVRTR